jgi:hypothetical protein
MQASDKFARVTGYDNNHTDEDRKVTGEKALVVKRELQEYASQVVWHVPAARIARKRECALQEFASRIV